METIPQDTFRQISTGSLPFHFLQWKAVISGICAAPFLQLFPFHVFRQSRNFLNILQRLSKISFLMYIFHPTAINLLKPVYDFTYEKPGCSFFSNFIYLGFILLVLIIFCELFNRYVNSIFNRVVNFFLQRDASSLSEKNCQ